MRQASSGSSLETDFIKADILVIRHTQAVYMLKYSLPILLFILVLIAHLSKTEQSPSQINDPKRDILSIGQSYLGSCSRQLDLVVCSAPH